MKHIVITGGHHSSALPVISELKKRYPDIKISWIGHKHSMAGDKNETLEYKDINDLGIPFYELKAGKFYRNFNPLKLWRIPMGFFQSFFLLRKLKPEVILSFGGYIAVPVVMSGYLLNTPSVTHEQTVVTGYANRLISLMAKKVLYTWPQSLERLPKHKSVLTGLPLRPEIFTAKVSEFEIRSRKPTIFITTGKSGSHIINMAVMRIMGDLLNIANVIHQTGDHSRYHDHQLLEQTYAGLKTRVDGSYYPRAFMSGEAVGAAYQAASLVISRSGAHTCYELLALNKPCLLIPISWSSHNEQYNNARLVKDFGLAEIAEEKKIKDEKYFLEVIKEVLENLDQYKCKEPFVRMENAAQLIVDEVAKIVEEK